jgi:segregation and condensation protein B
MDVIDIKPILEGLIFVSDSPIRVETLIQLLPELDKEVVLEGVSRLKKDFEDPSRGLELVEVAGGYQFRTKPKWGEWVNRLKKVKAVKLSQSALETLAIIAYRQPVIRPGIEEIRGVDSGWVLRTLMEKGLIKIVGRKDIPGRPIVYGTTQGFLELFGLSSLSELPTLKEILPPNSKPEDIEPEVIEPETAEPEGSIAEDLDQAADMDVSPEETISAEPEPPEKEADQTGNQEIPEGDEGS